MFDIVVRIEDEDYRIKVCETIGEVVGSIVSCDVVYEGSSAISGIEVWADMVV
jgi:hypothetical protein